MDPRIFGSTPSQAAPEMPILQMVAEGPQIALIHSWGWSSVTDRYCWQCGRLCPYRAAAGQSVQPEQGETVAGADELVVTPGQEQIATGYEPTTPNNHHQPESPGPTCPPTPPGLNSGTSSVGSSPGIQLDFLRFRDD